MTKRSIALLLVPLALVMGCRHNPPNTSPRVVFTQTLLSASQAVLLVSDGLVTANATFERLKAQSTIEDEYYTKGKAWIGRIAKANDSAIAAIRSAQAGNTQVNWRAALAAVATAASSEDPASFGFKNPDTQAAVKVALASLQLAISATASIGGAQ